MQRLMPCGASASSAVGFGSTMMPQQRELYHTPRVQRSLRLPISERQDFSAAQTPMKAPVSLVLAFTLAFGTPAALAQQSAEGPSDGAERSSETQAPAQRADQILYKGIVGNLLEAVPMDAEQRVGLQRGNALVSAPFSARSLALLLGITNPAVMIGGLIWGIWAASRIEAAPANPKAVAEPAPMLAHLSWEGTAGD